MKAVIVTQATLVILTSAILAQDLSGFSNWKLDGTTISATTDDQNKKTVTYSLDLGGCIANVDGVPQTAVQGAMGSTLFNCPNLSLTKDHPPKLAASCMNDQGDFVPSDLEINTLIKSQNGKFVCNKDDDNTAATSNKMRRGAHMVVV